jgi:hypothetical protein
MTIDSEETMKSLLVRPGVIVGTIVTRQIVAAGRQLKAPGTVPKKGWGHYLR